MPIHSAGCCPRMNLRHTLIRAPMRRAASALRRLKAIQTEAHTTRRAHTRQATKNEAYRIKFDQKAKQWLWSVEEKAKQYATRLKIEGNKERLYHSTMADLRARAMVAFWRYAGDKCGDAIGMELLWTSLEEVLPEDPARRALNHKVREQMERANEDTTKRLPADHLVKVIRRLQQQYGANKPRDRFSRYDDCANCTFLQGKAFRDNLERVKVISTTRPLLRGAAGKELEATETGATKRWRATNSPMRRNEKLWTQPMITMRPNSSAHLLHRTAGTNYLGPTNLGPPDPNNAMFRTYRVRPARPATAGDARRR